MNTDKMGIFRETKGVYTILEDRLNAAWKLQEEMMIEMYVAGIALDARNGHPIVILNDSTKRRALPIWIGAPEATAISRTRQL